MPDVIPAVDEVSRESIEQFGVRSLSGIVFQVIRVGRIQDSDHHDMRPNAIHKIARELKIAGEYGGEFLSVFTAAGRLSGEKISRLIRSTGARRSLALIADDFGRICTIGFIRNGIN